MTQLKDLKVVSSAGQKKLTIGQPTAANGSFDMAGFGIEAPAAQTSKRSKEVEKAVYAHIQALRSLGRTKVVVSDIAEALGLRQDIVLQALKALREKGVKLI